MERADVIAHAVVSVVLIVGLVILGVTRVITGEAVTVALLASGGVVGALSASDRMVYGKRAGKTADCEEGGG